MQVKLKLSDRQLEAKIKEYKNMKTFSYGAVNRRIMESRNNGRQIFIAGKQKDNSKIIK